MAECCISLGGNVGNVGNTFEQARAMLAVTDGLGPMEFSRVYQTAAVGNSAGDAFLNAAARFECTLSAEALLARLQQIESALGRIRTRRWSPRTIDLDLLFYGGEAISTPKLIVPHPACWYRRFVLDPMCDVAAGFMHPIRKRTCQQLRDVLTVRPLPVCLVDVGQSLIACDIASLAERFDIAIETRLEAYDTAALVIWIPPTSLVNNVDARFEQLPHHNRLELRWDEALGETPACALRDVLTAALDVPVPQTGD